jgi:CRISPR system Cascade subunit CasA
LEAWRERFWLFHSKAPFMQVAELAAHDETRDRQKPWTQIALASASGNSPLVFDHACDGSPVAIVPAKALCLLLGYLQFVPGGLVKVFRGSDKAGALANTAAVLPVGNNLAQTLCLCLHPAPTVHAATPDRPAWERQPLTITELCGDPVLATGTNDRYTHQSRAVLLLREADGSIRWLRFAVGRALGEDPNAPDSMASFRAGTSGLVRLTFREGRAFWRDLPALVPNPDNTSQPAAVLNHAAALHREISFEIVHQPVLAAGLASDQAKLERWRIEQITLPAALLADVDQAKYLREQVAFAEELFYKIRALAAGMLAETLPDPQSKDTKKRASNVLNAGPLSATYFAQAERSLPKLLESLSIDSEQARIFWHEALRGAAQQAWQQVVNGLGASARVLRADAKYWPRFRGLLNKQLPSSNQEERREQ